MGGHGCLDNEPPTPGSVQAQNGGGVEKSRAVAWATNPPTRQSGDKTWGGGRSAAARATTPPHLGQNVWGGRSAVARATRYLPPPPEASRDRTRRGRGEVERGCPGNETPSPPPSLGIERGGGEEARLLRQRDPLPFPHFVAPSHPPCWCRGRSAARSRGCSRAGPWRSTRAGAGAGSTKEGRQEGEGGG